MPCKDWCGRGPSGLVEVLLFPNTKVFFFTSISLAVGGYWIPPQQIKRKMLLLLLIFNASL